ncbi:MAG: phenylalanine--tRNA ligase subunit beta [Candidatus Levybacteria bacterium]|nr:phenylalanine--tRNA ligase subunit beta [Candidatus Levybacteria bacterium]
MLAPLSWLKEYVDIKLTPKELGEKLTEVGLGVEKITKTSDDTIFELEITPNRPDLLSIIGITREIAAIENQPAGKAGKNIKYPKFKTQLKPTAKVLPLTIKTDSKINPRFTGIIISGVKVGESPKWLKDRLEKMGQRPINNIVDITNYVMLELGNPIHAFDYDKIAEHIMIVSQTKGGEKFESVDGVTYHLPKDTVVISDKEKIIDLCGIKGGRNTGTYEDTKTIFIRVPVEISNLIRRTSLSLGLRSEASSIFERGVNAGGTIDALKRTVDLVLELAGGEVASELYDIKKEYFKPWKLELRVKRLNQILGIEIPTKKILEILGSLNLSPIHLPGERKRHLEGETVIECAIPTYRNDLKIEEDLIEEIARIYGYNNFPKTMPGGTIPTKQIPYFKDYRLDEKVKNILKASGFSEIYTYSLISEKDLIEAGINSQNVLRVDNPVSRDFEYLRPTLKTNLLKALSQNKSNFEKINLFELGKVYNGKNLDEAEENYFLSGISNSKSYFEVKGMLEKIFEDLGIKEDPTRYIEILNERIFFELNYSELIKKINPDKKFIPLPKYPPIVEDLSIISDAKTSEIIDEIKKQSSIIVNVSLLDQFEDSRTFHIVYQDENKNLTGEEVAKIREKLLKSLKEKFTARLRE